MKWTVLAAAAMAAAAILPAGPANAAGCVKGAIVGGVAGHYLANHGWLGAAAGCLIGRHEANRSSRVRQRPTRQYYAHYR